MTHVVTQSCVGDGSCVHACPVNCIQPTPDDPSFELAEMLHIDPATCVDCGACVTACPVDAIKPHTRLSVGEQAFARLNARYYRAPRARPPLAPVRPRLRVRDLGEPLRVAIVGSGPAAMYAADEVLTIPGARVDVYEREPVPYGLVRSGVAPDHRRTRRVARQLDIIRRHPGLRMHLGVEIGRHFTHDELLERHHAVVYAIGAAADRRLDVPGAERAVTATELVSWYNGRGGRAPDLSHPRTVIVGNGNVGLDIARLLTVDPAMLEDTPIAPAALDALRASRVEEVVVAGRRGPEHAAFTLPELVGLTATPGISVVVRPDEVADAPGGDAKLELLRSLTSSRRPGRRISLRFGLVPERLEADAVHFARETIEAGLLVTSIGFRGLPVPGLPYDPRTGTVPNHHGRVIDTPRVYVVGWIKRGPRGFIGTNKACSQDTVVALVEDHNAGRLQRTRFSPRAATPVTGQPTAPRLQDARTSL